MRGLILKQFIKKPFSTGALCSSSKQLAKAITSEISLDKAKSVVELGPGTGAVTKHILRSVTPDTKFFAVELNKELFHVVKKKFPEIRIYNDNALNLSEMLKKENLSHIDVVVSGLPWASFPEKLQDELLSVIVKSLSKGGIFTTFAYIQGMLLPSAWSFRDRLQRHFSVVKTSPIVWTNIPPAFVYRCRK